MSSRPRRAWFTGYFRIMGWVGGLVATSMLGVSQIGSELQFAEITIQSHVDFNQQNSATSNKYLIETMGGGVALFDYDNDNRLDIFFTNGALLSDPMPDGKMPDKSDKKFWNRLYHQNADGTFSDVTEHAGLTGLPQGYYSMGVAVGDYDNDGFDDLYVTGYGGNILYHNNGDGTFTDVTEKAGVKGGDWSASAGFFDYDNDGKLDLLVTRYIEWTFKTNRYCGERPPNGVRAYCHPDNYAGLTNILYHNNGDGTFTDVSQKAGIANPHGKGLGVSFADYDGDGFEESLWRMIPCSAFCTTTTATVLSLKWACWPASATTKTVRLSQVWGSTSATTTMMVTRHICHRPFQRALHAVSQ